MTQNDPALVEELGRLHDAYERALAANDVDALSGYFWDSPHVVRYGVAEQLYGTDELRAYRQGHTPPFTDRRIVRRHITIFGSTFANVMSEIEMLIGGARRSSRQSQVWVLMPSVGWRMTLFVLSIPAFILAWVLMAAIQEEKGEVACARDGLRCRATGSLDTQPAVPRDHFLKEGTHG